MKQSNLTEEQTIGIMREEEAGSPTAEVCRSPGFSRAPIFAGRAKFGGLEVSEAKRLKAVEEERARLKRLLGAAMLDNVGLKDLLSRKW